MPNHPIVHIEIAAKEPKAAGKFYQEVFGWTITVDERFDYVQFDAGEGPGGAFPGLDEQYKPGDVVIYILTEDIDATLAQVKANGGKALLPKTEIPEMGWYAFFADPTGNRIGLFTSMGNP